MEPSGHNIEVFLSLDFESFCSIHQNAIKLKGLVYAKGIVARFRLCDSRLGDEAGITKFMPPVAGLSSRCFAKLNRTFCNFLCQNTGFPTFTDQILSLCFTSMLW